MDEAKSSVGSGFRLFTRNEGDHRTTPAPVKEKVEEYFNQFGIVTDVHHPKKQPSMCYISFSDEAGLTCALDSPDHEIDGIYLSVHRATDLTKKDQTLANRVFVTGVSDAVAANNGEDLREHFKNFGEIVDLFVPIDNRSGKPKGIAFVSYSNPDEANFCIESSPHEIFCSADGFPVEVECQEAKAKDELGGAASARAPPSRGGGAPSARDSERIFCTSVNDNLAKNQGTDLFEYFSQFGEITDVKIPREHGDPVNGRPKGIAFITFRSVREARAANKESPHSIPCSENQEIYTVESQAAKPNPDAEIPRERGSRSNVMKTDRIFIPGCHDSLLADDAAALTSYFSNFGEVTEFHVPKSQGRPTGIAFISFASVDVAADIVTDGVAGTTHSIAGIDGIPHEVIVKFSEPKPGSKAAVDRDKERERERPSSRADPYEKYESMRRARDSIRGSGSGAREEERSSAWGHSGRDRDEERGKGSGGYGRGANESGYGRGARERERDAPHSSSKKDIGKYRVVVFGVTPELNKDIMMGHFSHYGDVLDIFIPPSKGSMAYVSFGSRMALQACLADGKLRIGGQLVKEVLVADERAPTDAGRSGPPPARGARDSYRESRRDEYPPYKPPREEYPPYKPPREEYPSYREHAEKRDSYGQQSSFRVRDRDSDAARGGPMRGGRDWKRPRASPY